ncbi:hypothetical protein [Convivina intestini]|nr:hypothetical protein [Convivina intestini]
MSKIETYSHMSLYQCSDGSTKGKILPRVRYYNPDNFGKDSESKEKQRNERERYIQQASDVNDQFINHSRKDKEMRSDRRKSMREDLSNGFLNYGDHMDWL